MMDGDVQFVAPVLEALSNLNFFSNATLAESVLNKTLLNSANTKDLPTVLKFLLQFPNDEYIQQIVDSIRQDLKIDSILDDDDDNNKNDATLQAKDYEKLIFEALRSGMRFKQKIATVMLKTLKKLTSKVSFYLLFLNSTTSCRS